MFNILNHLDRFEFVTESSTQVTLRCPVCNSKIRVKKKNGAYLCVASCKSQVIRKAVNLHSISHDTRHFQTRPFEVPLPQNIQLVTFNNTIKPKVSTYNSEKHCQLVKRTEYEYSDNFKIIRIDLLVDNCKKFYPLTLQDETDKWIVDVPDDEQLYNARFLQCTNDFVTFVEGEKCATKLSNEGLLTLTAPSFGWSDKWLRKALVNISDDIGGLVYIPDNDDVGIKKALDVRDAAWSIGLPCKIVSLKKLLNEKEDVSDLIDRGIDVVSVIKEGL